MCEGVLLVDVMPRGETINSLAYILTFKKLNRCFRRKRQNKDPAHFHLFGPLKHALRGKKFKDDEAVIHAAKTWLRDQDNILYKKGIHALVSRWRKAVLVDGDHVE
jgi:hypothetical protein